MTDQWRSICMAIVEQERPVSGYAARHAHNPGSEARQWPVGYPWTVGYARNYRPRHGKRGAR